MATINAKTTMRCGSPVPDFMRFEHLIAMCEMTLRQKVRFARMSDIQRSCYLIDRCRQRVHAKHQSWEDYNPINLVKNGNVVLKKATDSFAKLDEVTVQAHQMMESFTTMLNGTANFLFGDKGRGVMLKMMNVIVNACLAKTNCVLISLLYNISAQFGAEIYAFIAQAFDFSPRVEAELQSADSLIDLNLFGKLSGMINTHRGICAGTLGSIIALILLKVLGLPRSNDVDSCLKFFGDRSRNLSNMFNFAKVATPMFTSVGEYLMNCAFGKAGNDHELESYLSGYDDWVEGVLSVNPVGQNLALEVEKDKELCFKIDRLYRKGIEFASILGANKKLSN